MRKKIVRFEVQDLLPIGLTLVVAGIGLVYGLSVMGDVRSGICGDTGYTWNASSKRCESAGLEAGNADVNASTDAIEAVGKIPEKMPLIATVIVAAIIIGILVRYLMVRFT